VGIQIEVEPRVHHNREITLDLRVEISNVGETVAVGDSEAITIGTRTITSVIRLKSGESSLLAGLIRRDKTKGVTKTPLFGDIPVLGRLFRNETMTDKNTDLVLTLTPQIIRFPDIEAEDLAPVWVGTESRISVTGARPRVGSGRAPTGPFDSGSRGGQSDRTGRDSSSPTTRRPTAPRRVNPEEKTPNAGIELVPPPQDKSLSSDDVSSNDIGWEDVPEFVATEDIDSSVPPMLVGLEPSVISLRPGQETVLQIVVRGGSGSFRMPVGLSYDPTRVWIHDILPAPGVDLLRDEVDAAQGWIDLEFVVANAIESGQSTVALRVQALDAGPVPLVFSTAGATTAEGVTVPVAASDGALFVNGSGKVSEEP
jgi:general secretion pathway protein D